MIPSFPEFKKLSIDDNNAVEQHTRNFPYYSDYNFSSLFSWDIEQKRELSLLNNNLVVKFTDYETGDPFFSYLGMHKNLETIRTLLNYSESIGLPAELRLMPEISIHDIDTEDIEITADRANFDYIYLTSRMAVFQGNQYKSKRKAAERFSNSNPAHKFEILDLREPETQRMIRWVTASWRIHHGITEDDQSIIHETEAIENIFKLANTRNLFVGVLLVNDQPVAYTIEEIINNILSIGHFWKTAENSRGEYEFLACKMAAYLQAREVTYWNWEQDLGIDSLRNSKSSYRPSDFLKKFTVSRKSRKGIVL